MPDGQHSARRRRTSARTRILGMTVAVVGLALLATVLLLRQVLLNDLDERVDRSLTQEAEEFAESIRTTEIGPDETPSAYTRRLLETYLITSVPSDDEVLIGAVDGRVFAQSRDALADITGLVGDLATVAEPERVTLSSDAGEVRVLAQPVVDDEQTVGALIVGAFLDGERGDVDRTIRNAAFVALAALLAAIALSWFVAGRVLRPIRLVADTARDITEHDITQRIPDQGSDEIASLIESFNEMLDRLQAGSDNQRRFLDDAGHELRTPLTILRGHIELAAGDPEGFVESTPTVLAELDRMGRIVDDLLTMARAEQGAFLHVAPIDLDEFVLGLLPLVQPLGNHRWQIDEVPFGVVHADRDRLTQAMLNLAVNAARHTPEDGTIELGGRFDGETASLFVADTGEGVDPGEHDRIFARFHRASTGRSKGGTAGLGLSIVATIAEAHGGSVSVDSSPGEGSTFTITIPAQATSDGDDQESAAEDEEEMSWPAS